VKRLVALAASATVLTTERIPRSLVVVVKMRRVGCGLVMAVALIATGCGAVPTTNHTAASASRINSPTPSNVACSNSAQSTAFLYSAVFLKNQNSVLLFGGDWMMQPRVAETWQYLSGCWTKVSPAASPSLRDSVTMAYDPVRRMVVMYGGRVGGPGEPGKFIFDTWTWDGQTWAAASATGPELVVPTAAYDPISKRIILFGVPPRGEAETWAWTGQAWQLLHPTDSPSGRSDASLAFDSATAQLLLFGGAQTLGPLGETWTWNGSTWHQIGPAATPSPRYGAALGANGATPGLVLYGGSDSSHAYIHTETWIWDGRTWTQASPAHIPLSGFGGVAVATDAGLELFGRTNREVWRWSGGDWHRIN
jgi:hypothetical protein